MGKLQNFEIILSDNKVVYSAGESITGTLKISTDQPLQCKVIKVNCQGFCGLSCKRNDTELTEEEQYFNSTVSVADQGTLNKGNYSFPFKFLIPASTPNSFEGPHGGIMYRVRAFIDTPRFSKDYKTEKPFHIRNLLNLNDLPDIKQPSKLSTTKTFTYLLVKSGTITMKAKCDLRGYVPGQVIKLQTLIHNESGKDTGSVVASLMQKVTYKTKKATCDQRVIAEVEGNGVKAGKQVEWQDQIIVLPLPQSPLIGCELIEIDYFIQVALKSPEVVLSLPIYIGDIAINITPDIPPSAVPLTPAPSADPTPPPRPIPRTRRSAVSPSAPPANEALGEMGAGGAGFGEMPNKSHLKQNPSGPQSFVSPNAFSYAPDLAFIQNPSRRDSAATTDPSFSGSTAPPMPLLANGSAPALLPTLYPLILPPNYIASEYPHEAPPTYEESSTNNINANLKR